MDLSSNIGVLYSDMGRFQQAIKYLRQGLSLREKYLNPNDARLQSLRLLAGVYHKQGDYAKAQPLLIRALEITKRSGYQS